jgi:CRISPR-associated protein Csd1
MLLERLREYADRRLALPPPNYQEQAIRYIIDLDRDGHFLGMIDTADPAIAEVRRGVRRLAPAFVRTSGIRPKLLVDKGSYVLGYVPSGATPKREAQEHAAFIALTNASADATNEPAVRAIAQFLSGGGLSEVAMPHDFDGGASITFRVDGVFPIDLPSVQAHWASLQGTGAEPTMACVACGEIRPVLSGHPVTIKRIPSGQTSGNFLISANAAAFESYGLERSLIAPTCSPCAQKYGTALNALIGSDETSLRLGDVVYAFWTAEDTGFKLGSLLSDPDASEVRALLDAARTGKVAATDIENTAFYAVGLSGSGARIAVRTWIDTTVGEAKRRLAHYFALQTMVEWDGQPGNPLPVWRLANATVRNPRRETPAAAVTDGLFELALAGRRLPEDVLFRAVQRARAGQGVNRERAALIKMALGSEEGWTTERIEAMSGLDETNHDPAYLCGRLLAVLDAIQRQAISPNATVVDRFYGAAASAPASIFGNLLDTAQKHLAKMRKDPRTQAAGRALDGRLMEVMDAINGSVGFPKTLTLPQQGMFALGFYHQRAADRRAARERSEERRREAERDGAN